MKLQLLTSSLLVALSSVSLPAALVVKLNPDFDNNIIVTLTGSGTTGDDTLSSLTNGITFGEQWANLTGNPFDDTLDPNNFDMMFEDPVLIQEQGPTQVFITGIQIDNDPGGVGADDFRIYVNQDMLANTAYAIDGVATIVDADTLSFDNVDVGTYTDDADDGTAFLGGFSLVIDATAIPEPSAFVLVSMAMLIALSLNRRKS